MDTLISGDYAEGRGNGVRRNTVELVHGEVTEAAIGAFFAVHTELGYGFLEGVYRNALQVVFQRRGLRAEREVPYDVMFQGHVVGRYKADLVVEGRVVIEVKAERTINPNHLVQLRNYLKASGLEVGLLLNFGRSAEFKRLILQTNARISPDFRGTALRRRFAAGGIATANAVSAPSGGIRKNQRPE
jgi:GxxExxY protein